MVRENLGGILFVKQVLPKPLSLAVSVVSLLCWDRFGGGWVGGGAAAAAAVHLMATHCHPPWPICRVSIIPLSVGGSEVRRFRDLYEIYVRSI